MLNQGASRMMERQRCILHLIQEYLDRHKYTLSSDAVTSEANLSPNIRVSENIDLEIIFTEYESFYRMKYNKNPLFCRPVEGSEGVTNNKKKGKPVSKPKIQEEQTKQNVQQVTSNGSTNDVNLAMIVTPIFPNENEDRSSITELQYNRELHIQSNLSRCVELYPVDSELRKFAEDISREIVVNNLNVHWNDVIGLETCKAAVKEAIVYPVKYPIFFADKFSPWKGLLLYGPPGTGKTMLAKAIATECNCTFFNITASSLVSKWRGDSEKYIRVLFELAHKYSPTIIFIDEIDWIATKTCPESHVLSEPAKRFRSELLTSLDGLMSPQNSNVVLLATTNAPWNIDEALLRRLEKRIYVELPDTVSKFNIFKLYVSNDILNTLKNSASDSTKLKNCSAADIIQICKQAWMHQSTPMWKRLESKEITLTSDLKYEITDSNSFFDTFDKYQPIIKNVANYNKWTGVI
ncbi:Katanin p60 ATPase-containing subunit A-like 2 [Habropoda laboriosa]|uniref:Katanin p60 ATPase-containing subunit A-like 2 n=1 Tax=Habropoda laboriosa TaxID=597456 RepID=A0A0L7R646_9HYME|nr:Katanin p60 ATPase-containing subunit A-like 2 [Habropoda laboriosa]